MSLSLDNIHKAHEDTKIMLSHWKIGFLLQRNYNYIYLKPKKNITILQDPFIPLSYGSSLLPKFPSTLLQLRIPLFDDLQRK
jgi:hypothetical protein